VKRQPGARHAPRTRRLPGRWLAALLIAGAVALLAPGVSNATASQSSTAASNAASGCRGITPAIIPATGGGRQADTPHCKWPVTWLHSPRAFQLETGRKTCR